MTHTTRGREPTLDDEVRAEIKAARARRSLTQEQVASAVGMTQETYSRKERGLVPFTLPEVMAVAIALSVPAGDLFPDRHITRASA